MVKLTFYGGVNEIGGNKILLEDQDAKIFLDFGMSFGQANNYFSEFLPGAPSMTVRPSLLISASFLLAAVLIVAIAVSPLLRVATQVLT